MKKYLLIKDDIVIYNQERGRTPTDYLKPLRRKTK